MKNDLKRISSQTNFRLIVGLIAITLILGNILVAIFYGQNAAILSLLCMLSALIPVALVMFVLFVLDWITKRLSG